MYKKEIGFLEMMMVICMHYQLKDGKLTKEMEEFGLLGLDKESPLYNEIVLSFQSAATFDSNSIEILKNVLDVVKSKMLEIHKLEEGIKKYRSPKANQIYIDEQDKNIIRNDGDAEHRVAVKMIKKQKRQLRALKLHRHKPTQMEMKEIIDKHRFKSNDKANCTKIGNELDIDPETAKRWIQKLGLSDYAFNPKHLK